MQQKLSMKFRHTKISVPSLLRQGVWSGARIAMEKNDPAVQTPYDHTKPFASRT